MNRVRALIFGMCICLGSLTAQAGGFFSIDAEGRKVQFADGNLSLSTANYQWSFLVSEGAAEENVTGGAPSSVIDLFGWSGSTYNYWGISALEDAAVYGGTFNDWANAVNGEGDNYVTLSAEEWQYILYGRANAASLKEYTSAGWIIRSDDESEHITLPISGIRHGGQSVDMTQGAYWTSTAVGTDSAKCLILNADTIFIATRARATGASVRFGIKNSQTITVEDTDCEEFDHWADNNSTERERTIGGDEAVPDHVMKKKNFTLKGATNAIEKGTVQITIIQRNE